MCASAGPGRWRCSSRSRVGIVGGAIWAGIAGALRFWRNVPEVLTTLLMGVVAANLMGWGLRNRFLLLAPAAGRANRNQVSEPFAPSRRIPRVTLVRQRVPDQRPRSPSCWRSSCGWCSVARSSGSGCACWAATPAPRSAPACREKRYGLGAMLVSGGFAGLAGGVMLTGGDFGNYQLVANFGAGIGFAGLLAALVARQRAIVLIFVAFLFGGLRTGSGFLRSTGVSARIADVVQGMLVLAHAAAAGHPVPPGTPTGARRHEREDLTMGNFFSALGDIFTNESAYRNAVIAAVVLLFAASGELVAEKAGTINISVEAMMLAGAFGAAVGQSTGRGLVRAAARQRRPGCSCRPSRPT